MFRVFLAGRYTVARPVSYLAMVSIGLAIMALIVVWSIMNGFLEQTRDILRGSMADIVVFPVQRHEPAPRELLEALAREHPDVAAVSSRLVRPAIFKKYGSANVVLGNMQDAQHTQLMVMGMDAQAELAHTDLRVHLTNVHDPVFRVADPERPFDIALKDIALAEVRFNDPVPVLLGEATLRMWGLRRGDAIELVTLPDGMSLDGEPVTPTVLTFVIAGAFNSHHTDDNGKAYIPRADFGDWAGTVHELSELYVSAKPGVPLERLRDELGAVLDSSGVFCDVQTWEDRNKTWLAAVENERNILFVILGFFLLLVCTISFSVLTMLVQEKVRDIGILSAMGASSGGVGGVFAVVGMYIATLGGLLGLAAGWALSTYINDVKDLIEHVFEIQIFDRNVYAFSEIPTAINMDHNLIIAGVTMVAAVIICLLPAWRAARLDPVEALRHE
ncbi:MAG: hypothetical protein DRQ55_02850 [Planctomycetota bacterium]|nr:MAG: hypothetical protein DRQ55_02850 [Planctomycetota bacterium]